MTIPAPVQVVLDTLRRHGVQALLMGGQACIVYGASEFSRDVDLAVLADDGNLRALSAALDALQADVIAVPPFDAELLRAGHSIHFRCRAPGVAGLRVDVMSRMRGVDDFAQLWQRRYELPNGIPVLSLRDLIAAKKTQRDKDWPMLRRLVEADYFARRSSPRPEHIDLWLRECRTPALLREIARSFATEAARVDRTAVQLARAGASDDEMATALREEEDRERAIDAAYWRPLRSELERLRHARRQ